MATSRQAHRERPYGIPSPTFRLPDAAHVGVIRLQVSDLRRSLEYYQQILGFEVQTEEAGAAALVARGGDHVLVWLHTRHGIQPARRGAFGLFHFAILVPDRAALGRFAAHLARVDAPVASADHRVSEALYLWDPDGLGIEVYADRPREIWEHHGRQLIMTTEPLDMQQLITAASERSWDGMPTATTIGHVHLHVGNLERAQAFYHHALGFDKTVWDYPGALFFSAGGYHHHLGTNTWSRGPAAGPDEAQLLEWELVVPQDRDASDVAQSLRTAGYAAARAADGFTTSDPWGTRVRIVADQ
jgi:catechol 2,3-dioxygenase